MPKRKKEELAYFKTYLCKKCNIESGYPRDYKFKIRCKHCNRVLEDKKEDNSIK